MTAPWLPNLLREVKDVFGLPTALRLAEKLGGQYVLLPAKPKAQHPVAQAVGRDVLAWLIATQGKHTRVVIPRAAAAMAEARKAEIRRLSAEGLTANQIAQQVGVHVRVVELWRRATPDPRQRGLFEEDTA